MCTSIEGALCVYFERVQESAVLELASVCDGRTMKACVWDKI